MRQFHGTMASQLVEELIEAAREKKEEDTEWICKLEGFVHSSQEHERSREEWMQEEIKRQVQAAISSMMRGGLHHHSQHTSTLDPTSVEEKLRLHGSTNHPS